MSSLFEQWKADHTALTFESWLVKRVKVLSQYDNLLHATILRRDTTIKELKEEVELCEDQLADNEKHIKELEARLGEQQRLIKQLRVWLSRDQLKAVERMEELRQLRLKQEYI